MTQSTITQQNKDSNMKEENTLPRWQQLSGLGGENESEMSDDARDAGIRKLLAEVDHMAKIEFARGESTPAGERTHFWDPLARITLKLGISRTKLSQYSRELTGMRANELTDRFQAMALPRLMKARIELNLEKDFATLRETIDRTLLTNTNYQTTLTRRFMKIMRGVRSGILRAGFACEMGFANPARLSRACLLAHRISIDELEFHLIHCMVQKFCSELAAESPAQPRSAAPSKPAQDDTIRKDSQLAPDVEGLILRICEEAVQTSR